MKKSFIRILILVMAISMIVPSFALAETGPSEGLISVSAPAPYRGAAIKDSLVNYTLSGTTLTVYGSGKIPSKAFLANGVLKGDEKKVTKVIIKGQITEIGSYAFYGCSNITSLDLSQATSLKTIRLGAFYSSSKLSKVSVPKNVTHVQDGSFSRGTKIACVSTNMKKYGYNGYKVLDHLVFNLIRDYTKAFEMVKEINKHRGSNHIKMDASLMEAAMQRAAEYVVLQSHTRPNGEDCKTIYGGVLEETSGHGASTASAMLTKIMSNTSNKNVIKSSEYNIIGVGCVQYNGVNYWVQCFGKAKTKPKENCDRPGNKTIKTEIELPVGSNSIKIYKKDSNYSYSTYSHQLSLSTGNVRIKKGDKLTTTLRLKRSGNLGNMEFVRAGTKWGTSNKNVATVASGVITGKAAGVATISAGSTLTKRASISVVVCDTGRLAGQNRIGTANTIATQYMKDTKQPKLANIIVVFSDNFPDALSASYLSTKYKAPIILTNPNVQKDVVTWIRKNVKAKGNVYFVGGTFVVPNSLKTSLASYGYKVTRVAGNDRYGTNKAVLQNVGIPKGSEIVVCDGGKFQNALIASATGKPMLLVSGSKLTNEQISLLNSQKVKDKNVKFVIVGNTSSVSASIATALSKYGKVERLSKSNPDAMSVAVAKRFWKNGSSKVFFATANNFPDALAGGPECIINKAPIFLITDKNYTETRNYCKNINNKVTKVTTFGGPFAVSDSTMTKAAGF